MKSRKKSSKGEPSGSTGPGPRSACDDVGGRGDVDHRGAQPFGEFREAVRDHADRRGGCGRRQRARFGLRERGACGQRQREARGQPGARRTQRGGSPSRSEPARREELVDGVSQCCLLPCVADARKPAVPRNLQSPIAHAARDAQVTPLCLNAAVRAEPIRAPARPVRRPAATAASPMPRNRSGPSARAASSIVSSRPGASASTRPSTIATMPEPEQDVLTHSIRRACSSPAQASARRARAAAAPPTRSESSGS